jgi:hypothetical protein
VVNRQRGEMRIRYQICPHAGVGKQARQDLDVMLAWLRRVSQESLEGFIFGRCYHL